MRERTRLNPSAEIDVGIIGGGIIGLSVARALAKEKREAIVFEAESQIGMHTSSRNSEVIHSGIYYQPGSLKAKLCVEGRNLLYNYCEENEVPYKKIGKLVVAAEEKELVKLNDLSRRGRENGVYDLSILDREQVLQIEPLVECLGGIFSPSTGILDSHAYMRALKSDAIRNGAWVQVLSPVIEGEIQKNGTALVVGGNENTTVLCKTVINAAGLSAQRVANKIDNFPKESIPPEYFAKGQYFMFRKNSPFSHLIYPLPVSGGLGIHVTIDMEGKARFGPDVEWVDSVDYSVDEAKRKSFFDAIRVYYPSIEEGDLEPGFSGVRPKTGPAGSSDQDFIIQGPKDHGIPSVINLFGIESPGLTASLAIADYVFGILEK